MMALISRALRHSSKEVLLEVNMISSPLIPSVSQITSSPSELQSMAIPHSSRRIFKIIAFGVALTAKCS